MMRYATGVLAAAMALTTGDAVAGNDDELLLGNQAAVMAGAVTATVADGAATFYNPAGVAAAQGQTVDVTASVFGVRLISADAILRGPDGGQGDGSVFEIVSVPSTLTYLRRLSPKLGFGFGVFVVKSKNYAQRAELTIDDARPTDWNLSEAPISASYRLGPSIGYEVAPGLRVGAALLAAYDSEVISYQFSGGERDPEDAGDSSFEVFTGYSQYLGVGVQGSAGIQADVPLGPKDDGLGLAFGAVVVTPAWEVYSSYQDSSNFGFAFVDETSVGTLFEAENINDSRAASFAAFAPFEARLGAAFRWKGGQAAVDGTFKTALSNAELEVSRTTLFNMRVGAQHAINESFMLGGGLFTDLNPKRKSDDDLLVVHADYFGGTLGVKLGSERKLDPKVEDVPWLHFATTLALRYAVGVGTIGGVRLPRFSNIDSASAFSLVEGDVVVHELSLHLGSTLGF